MPCYQCGSAEGTETILCPNCRKMRASQVISVQGTINGQREGIHPYVRLILDEWHLAIGLAILIVVGIKAVAWLVLRPSLPFDPTGLAGPDGSELQKACMEQLENSPLQDIDQNALVSGYRQELEREIAAPPYCAANTLCGRVGRKLDGDGW